MKKSELKSLIKECIKEVYGWSPEKAAKFKADNEARIKKAIEDLKDINSAAGKYVELDQFSQPQNLKDIQDRLSKRPEDVYVYDKKPDRYKWGNSTYLILPDGTTKYIGGDEDSSG